MRWDGMRWDGVGWDGMGCETRSRLEEAEARVRERALARRIADHLLVQPPREQRSDDVLLTRHVALPRGLCHLVVAHAVALWVGHVWLDAHMVEVLTQALKKHREELGRVLLLEACKDRVELAHRPFERRGGICMRPAERAPAARLSARRRSSRLSRRRARRPLAGRRVRGDGL
jgi:hypothetical protein